MDEIQSVLDFLDAGVSPWHAAAEACRRLEAAGFTRLEESQPWELSPGARYYVTRNGSAVLAFRLPEEPIRAMRIALSHSDAPTWRVKNAGVEKAGCILLQTEGYGGMIMSSWLDRPLTIAGRVVVRTAEGIETRLVCADQDLLVIPSLAIHFDRGVNIYGILPGSGSEVTVPDVCEELGGLEVTSFNLMEMVPDEVQAIRLGTNISYLGEEETNLDNGCPNLRNYAQHVTRFEVPAANRTYWSDDEGNIYLGGREAPLHWPGRGNSE